MVEIKTHCCGEIICRGETATLAVYTAAVNGVDLKGADFSKVDFTLLPMWIARDVISGMYSVAEVRDD